MGVKHLNISMRLVWGSPSLHNPDGALARGLTLMPGLALPSVSHLSLCIFDDKMMGKQGPPPQVFGQTPLHPSPAVGLRHHGRHHGEDQWLQSAQTCLEIRNRTYKQKRHGVKAAMLSDRMPRRRVSSGNIYRHRKPLSVHLREERGCFCPSFRGFTCWGVGGLGEKGWWNQLTQPAG